MFQGIVKSINNTVPILSEEIFEYSFIFHSLVDDRGINSMFQGIVKSINNTVPILSEEIFECSFIFHSLCFLCCSHAFDMPCATD